MLVLFAEMMRQCSACARLNILTADRRVSFFYCRMYICDIYCFYDLMFKMTDHLQPQGNSSPASETLSKVFSQLLKHSDIKT